MLHLPNAVKAWKSPAFESVLKAEIEHLDIDLLPLQQALSQSNAIHGRHFSAMIIGLEEAPDCLRARVGVFYSGLVAGCSCAADPESVDPINEYCELVFSIDRSTARATVLLLPTG
jgi:hypothetical protein